jgi:hypothetical protein
MNGVRFVVPSAMVLSLVACAALDRVFGGNDGTPAFETHDAIPSKGSDTPMFAPRRGPDAGPDSGEP